MMTAKEFFKGILMTSLLSTSLIYFTSCGPKSKPKYTTQQNTLQDLVAQPVKVTGTEAFVTQVKNALTLIKTKDCENYNKIEQTIAEINQGARSRIDVYKKIYSAGDKTAFHSLEWMAGTISHESMHVQLYEKYLQDIAVNKPAQLWFGRDAEIVCNKYQSKCLTNIGAPKYMIDYVDSLDGTHADYADNSDY